MTVYPHHLESLRRAVAYFKTQPEVTGLILGGSLAHGFAGPASDVDVMILVAQADYEARLQAGQLHFFSQSLCTYEGGYVDGKYIGPDFLRQVADQGSEPARFAFLNAKVQFSRAEGLDNLVTAIARYPAEGKAGRLKRFYAQFEAWHWYTQEALRLNNHYLLGVALSKLVLFGGRLILTHNELLYPYHKWFLKVLEQAEDKPDGMLEAIRALYSDPTQTTVDSFHATVASFQPWPVTESGWPVQFMLDSELTWLNGSVPLEDL